MPLAYIGLGSNLNDPARQIRRALGVIATLPDSRLLAASRLYRSPPMGPLDQPEYINAVAALETALAPRDLLHALQAIERDFGRVRLRRWGERIIDLDILAYDDLCLESPELTLPHPGIGERAFVLRPLAELVPELVIPGLGPLAELLAARATDICEPLEEIA
ncbi:MAG: 2-amino-4-hydroxy-6-hydroxymethyldihydropteridine diphosphokinase [Gammaproteobacteria bacterium]|nr:2-amino-4-hydroxy-6-hydroxymethyldihydropteridine diphosphokinase [Gammaproteobacteria bacterium]